MTFERVRRQKDDSFTTINNFVIRDKTLSLKAKALLLTVMGLPDTWDFSVAGIVAIVKEGKAAVYSALNELCEAKYVEKRTVREKGQFCEIVYTFHEQPINRAFEPHTDFPYTEKPDTDNPDTEKPDTDNRTQLKKHLIKETMNQETMNARDQKIEISTTIATNIGIGTYDPAGMLFDAFPQCQFHTTHIGFIESAVSDSARDREAWRLTVEKYQMNFDLEKKAYIPTKIGNVLDTFRSIRDRLPEPKQTDNPDWKDALNQQAEICKPIYVG